MKAAQYVRNYLGKHASVRDCLQKGLINYSQLTRDILTNASVHLPFDAVLAACRRLAKQLDEQTQEEQILNVLAESKIEVRNKVGVFVSHKIKDDKLRSIVPLKEIFHVAEGIDTQTFILPMEYSEKAEKILKDKIIQKHKNMLEIVLRSPKTIENTPGVLAFIYSLFGQYGINILESMSCWKDTIIIIHEKDMNKMVEALKFTGG